MSGGFRGAGYGESQSFAACSTESVRFAQKTVGSVGGSRGRARRGDRLKRELFLPGMEGAHQATLTRRGPPSLGADGTGHDLRTQEPRHGLVCGRCFNNFKSSKCPESKFLTLGGALRIVVCALAAPPAPRTMYFPQTSSVTAPAGPDHRRLQPPASPPDPAGRSSGAAPGL